MHAAGTLSWSPTVRSAITIGFIGGLTTYSSVNYETTRPMEEGATGAEIFNGVAAIVGAFVSGWLAWFARGSSSAGKEAVMRVLDGEQFLVRILLGESDQFHHMSLARRLYWSACAGKVVRAPS